MTPRSGLRRLKIFLALLPALALGCNRGSHPSLVGHHAPDFVVQDSDRRVELNDIRGKVVVLNFWATWCPPCVEEMPSLGVMQTRLSDRVTVLAVSIDADGDAYHRFLREHGINFLTVRDPEQKASDLYGSHGWPETYIIDRNGFVRRKFIGPVDWTRPDMIAYLDGL